jgi:large subunit ribosomal protein L4e
MRGRRWKRPVGPLFVLTDRESPLALSVRNLPGVDVVEPRLLSVIHLAPGGSPARLTVYQEASLEELRERFKVSLP